MPLIRMALPHNHEQVAKALAADAVPWAGVSGKPSTFPPSIHGMGLHETFSLAEFNSKLADADLTPLPIIGPTDGLKALRVREDKSGYELAEMRGGGGADLSLVKWRDPVGALVDTLPATCTTGDRVILSTDKKIYTATGTDTWGTGVAPENSWALVCSATDKIYVYDADGSAWVAVGDSGTVPDATAASKGVVSVPSGSGLAVTAGAVSLVRHEFRESVTLTAGDISSKGITLSKVPTAGQEAATRVNVIGGLYAPYGTDYVVTGTSLSWNALGLDGLLQAGDTIDVSYWTDEA